MNRTPIISCPNCQAVWGFDEIEEESCFACGYPNNEEEDEDDFDHDNDLDPEDIYGVLGHPDSPSLPIIPMP